MRCNFCEGYANLLSRSKTLSKKGDFFPGIDVDIDGDVLRIVAAPDTYEPGFMEAEVKINFCPMCGENLRKEGE